MKSKKKLTCPIALQERADYIYDKVSAGIMTGAKRKEIAYQLNIEPSHVTNIYAKEVKRRIANGELLVDKVVDFSKRNQAMLDENLDGMKTLELAKKYGMNRGYVAAILREEKNKLRIKELELLASDKPLSGWAKRMRTDDEVEDMDDYLDFNLPYFRRK
jgi:hypothetical protein